MISPVSELTMSWTSAAWLETSFLHSSRNNRNWLVHEE